MKKAKAINKYCECGCGGLIPYANTDKSPSYLKKRRYIRGHSNYLRKGKYTSKEPTWRLYRERARNLIDLSICSINSKDCLGRIEAAHIDQDYTNNDIENIKPLCHSHHLILDNHYKNGMRYEHLFRLKLKYTVSSGKRRYKKSSFGGY